MKKVYMKPTMRVVRIQRTCLICSSDGNRVSSINNSDGISKKSGGFYDDDYDM